MRNAVHGENMCKEETIEFEREISFKDRKGRSRCFYVRVVIPMFIHEEELHAQVAGEPVFNLILRDCDQTVGEHDLENFIDAVKEAAVKEYAKTFGSSERIRA
jgi:hypothetical protein